MRNSTRSQVDPFIVMDVMEAARQAEDAGRDIIHMEVGQPSTGAPRGATDALARALEHDALGYTVALGLPALRQRIARLYGEWYDVDLNPERVVITPGSSGGVHPGLYRAVRYRRPGGDRRAGLPVLSSDPQGAGPGARGPAGGAGEPVSAGGGGFCRDGSCRPDGGLARQPDRHDARQGRARRADRRGAGAGGVLHQRRDLSRAGIREKGGDGAGDQRRCLCDQLFLQVFLDDRLAGRLDGGARGSRAGAGADRAEHVHLRPARQPGGGAGGDGLRRGAAGQSGGLPPQPRADAGGAAEGGLRQDRAAGRGRSISTPTSRS